MTPWDGRLHVTRTWLRAYFFGAILGAWIWPPETQAQHAIALASIFAFGFTCAIDMLEAKLNPPTKEPQ